MSKYVYCRFRVTGFHSWPGAPKGLVYLANNHRHEFHFEVSVEVVDNDREIEFITLKEKCLLFLHNMYEKDVNGNYIFGHRSCEMIGTQLMKMLIDNPLYNTFADPNQFPNTHKRDIVIDVAEDGENGAVISRL